MWVALDNYGSDALVMPGMRTRAYKERLAWLKLQETYCAFRKLRVIFSFVIKSELLQIFVNVQIELVDLPLPAPVELTTHFNASVYFFSTSPVI